MYFRDNQGFHQLYLGKELAAKTFSDIQKMKEQVPQMKFSEVQGRDYSFLTPYIHRRSEKQPRKKVTFNLVTVI